MKASVSVIVPTRNEESNIRACLESVSFADDTFVVDSQSLDNTCAIAEEMGAKVVQFHYAGGYPKKKNWALENLELQNEWVLILDADERVTPELAEEIAAKLAAPDADGYYIPRRFMFMGRWIRHCGYYPSYVLRLFRHRLGRYETPPGEPDAHSGDVEIHERLMLKGRAGYLKNPMLHHAYPDIATWIEKHNRYSSWEAVSRAQLLRGGNEVIRPKLFGNRLERKRWAQRLASRLPFGPTLRFLYHYVLRFGFLDGYPGYVLSRLLAQYEFWSRVKRRELARKEEHKA